eukprot:GFKZ01008533.1.p1 GENE.GFKZ01008533.1~~GFKZ01008533.1.p1  ORF type:complete len:1028 (+),score=182.22 GFKZ01008533.1:617-3700(+)
MQFFDRPGRSRIALGGSSSRTTTSAQLLAQARKAREQRANRRAQHAAALTLQSSLRRHLAFTNITTQLVDHAPRDQTGWGGTYGLSRFLFMVCLSGRLDGGLGQRMDSVKRVVVAREELGRVVRFMDADRGPLVEAGVMTDGMVVKALAVVLEVARKEAVEGVDVQPVVRVARRLMGVVGEAALPEMARWGICRTFARLVACVGGAGVEGELLGLLAEELLAVVETGGGGGWRSVMYRQLAMGLLSQDAVLERVRWTKRPDVVRKLLRAMAEEDVRNDDDGFLWDVGMSVNELDTREVAICLSNVLELGDATWAKQHKETLWAVVNVVSSLLELLPQHVLVKPGQEDDLSDYDLIQEVDNEGVQDARVLQEVVGRLGIALKRIVSDENVRALLTSSVAEGRHAVIRVCQLFNFLTRREKSLNMSLQNAVAFWRGSRSSKHPHILASLWKLCLKSADDSGSSDAILDATSSPLREDTAPILVIFACAYSYLLYIQDEDEMFETQWPFSVDEVREISLVLKQYLFSALYVRPTKNLSSASSNCNNLLRKEPGLLEEVSRLLSRLYNCDARRQFRTSDDFWLAGRGALSSEGFLEDAIRAGPEALEQAPERNAFGGVRQVSSRHSSVSGAGELLRLAPHLVPFSSRAKIFQSWVARERDRANGGRSFFVTIGRSVSVRRKFIFEDAFEELNGLGPELKSTIRVKFIDEHGIEEAGIDGGGVFKEFMYEVLRLGFSPFSYGLFQSTQDGRLYPNPNAAVASENFKTQFAFLGRLLGKAVFDGVLVDIPLARFFLSKILGQFNYPNDLGSLDPELHKNMKFLKNCPPEMVEDLGLNFTVANNAFGEAREIELVRNGTNIPVTAANRIEYIHRVANYRMNTQIKQQSEAFLQGFSEVVSPQYIRLFSHEELQLLISGKVGKIDLDDLRRNTKYSGGYDEHTDVIKWFWEAFSELEAEYQSKMLQFVTSSPRAPLLGFSYLVPGFCIHRAEGDVRLPTASTCMNLLKLPQYKSLDIVRQKLRYALDSNAGFDLS